MKDSPLVRDVMVPTVQFEANTEVGDALQKLDQQRIDYGVVIDDQGDLLVIVTREQLRTMKANERLQTITANRAYPLPIEPDEELDEVVRISADDFSFNQNPLGIVVQKQGSIYGVLLRETIDEQAASLLVGRRLAGKPLKDAPKRIVFQCPVDAETRDLSSEQFNPHEQQICKQGHKMRRIKG